MGLYISKGRFFEMYISLTMGNVVDTKLELIRQVFESYFCFHTLDFRWKRYHEDDY